MAFYTGCSDSPRRSGCFCASDAGNIEGDGAPNFGPLEPIDASEPPTDDADVDASADVDGETDAEVDGAADDGGP